MYAGELDIGGMNLKIKIEIPDEIGQPLLKLIPENVFIALLQSYIVGLVIGSLTVNQVDKEGNAYKILLSEVVRGISVAVMKLK